MGSNASSANAQTAPPSASVVNSAKKNNSTKKNNSSQQANATVNAAKNAAAATYPPTSQLQPSSSTINAKVTVGGWTAKAGIPVKYTGGRRRKSIKKNATSRKRRI